MRKRWAMTHNVHFLLLPVWKPIAWQRRRISGALMPEMRFNHMELTFPRGMLTTELREDIDGFYGSVFGWIGVDAEVVGQLCHILLSEEAQQFILLAESDKPIQSPGYDHLGLLFATRERSTRSSSRSSGIRRRTTACASRSTTTS